MLTALIDQRNLLVVEEEPTRHLVDFKGTIYDLAFPYLYYVCGRFPYGIASCARVCMAPRPLASITDDTYHIPLPNIYFETPCCGAQTWYGTPQSHVPVLYRAMWESRFNTDAFCSVERTQFYRTLTAHKKMYTTKAYFRAWERRSADPDSLAWETATPLLGGLRSCIRQVATTRTTHWERRPYMPPER